MYYNNTHKYYCGIDLHANTLYVCILDNFGEVVFHKEIKANRESFLVAIETYREGLVVGVESTFCWYWLADLCEKEGIKFVLGHALYMKAIHGGKAKNDRLDSHKLAVMLRGGMFPLAYVYPKELRALRDLLRRRLFFVRKKAELISHIQMTHQQYNYQAPGSKLKNHNFRDAYELPFADEVITKMVSGDLELIKHYTKEIHSIEFFVRKKLKEAGQSINLAILSTVPGIGPILSLTILLELHTIARFPTVSHFCSYARLIKPEKTSAGKKAGSGGKKIGNPYLKWAFSEATALTIRCSDDAKKYKQRLCSKYSKAKAMSIFSHRLGKSVYFMLQRKQEFNSNMFFAH